MMVLALRILHHLGNSVFISSLVYIVFLLQFQDGTYLTIRLASLVFYIFTVPGLILVFLSGIFLIVFQNYVLREEDWLKQKGVFTLIIMLLIILIFFPEMKSVLQVSVSSAMQIHTGRLTVLSIALFFLALGNMGIAFAHRPQQSR